MRVLITGSSGVIGNILVKGLHCEITEFDLPNFDVREYSQLVTQLKGHDAVIHLAWNTKEDNFRSDFHDPDNTKQVFNVYRAAIEARVPRVIMASSVHADKFENRNTNGLLNPYALPLPDSPYGAGKCSMESLGRYYADNKGLEVICIRFGGVNVNNIPSSDKVYSDQVVWLTHKDCIELVTHCLDTKNIPNNYTIIYAVSDNKYRIHDYSNPVGWVPKEGIK